MNIKLSISLILLAIFASCKKSDPTGDTMKSKDAANDIVAYVKSMLSEVLTSIPARKDLSSTESTPTESTPTESTPTESTPTESTPTEPTEPSDRRKITSTGDQEPSEFKAAYDSWTKKALAEFPDLGIANSRLNTLFLARARSMREANSNDLKYPNWPYVLAVQINQELIKEKDLITKKLPEKQPASLKTETTIKALEPNAEFPKTNIPVSQLKSQVQPSAPPKEDWTWTVKELSQLPNIPNRATVRGTVTKIQKQIAGDPFDIILTLDNMLTCEINVRQAMQTEHANPNPGYYPYYGVTQSSNLELVHESSSIRLRQRNVSTVTRNVPYYYSDYWYNNRSSVSVNQRDLLVIKLGDDKSIKGILTRKPSGKVVLKGQLQ